jgi:polyferredoxin
LALKVMLGLTGLSFVIPYFWCRYLCPYGAVLSVLGFLSIGSIQRDPDLCTRCGACEKHCPGLIQIRQKQRIRSPECSACLSCVSRPPSVQIGGHPEIDVEKMKKMIQAMKARRAQTDPST